MEGNFSNRVQDVIRLSREEALRLGHDYIGTEHLLLGVIREGEGIAVKILRNIGVDLFKLKKAIEEVMDQFSYILIECPPSPGLLTGDLGFGSTITYDLEAWAAGSGEWLEVSSISDYGSFQSRRAGIRFRRDAASPPEYVHTLNGSGLALPRTLIACLENNRQADGSIVVPEVLRGRMGMDVIGG